MGEGEDDGCLVDFAFVEGEVGAGVCQDEEAGVVLFHGLDAVGEDLEAVELGGISTADGGMASDSIAGNVACAAGGVEVLHHLHAGMPAQPCLALHECHGVAVDLGDIFEARAWEGTEGVGYAHLVLAHDAEVGPAEEFVVALYAAGDGVFECRQAEHGGVGVEGVEEVGEGVAAFYVEFAAGETVVGCGVVEAAFHALHGNFQGLCGCHLFKIKTLA